MCGIFASISQDATLRRPSSALKERLRNRGPDHFGTVKFQCDVSSDKKLSLLFHSTVLALRGGHVVEQPLVDAVTGSILCWNGEAWKIGSDVVQHNDGEVVLQLLASSVSNLSKINSVSAIVEVFGKISGPFAFVYFDKANSLVYFGRDRLGRRSLLRNGQVAMKSISFSSISDPGEQNWKEVEADGLYMVDLKNTFSAVDIKALNAWLVQDTSFAVYRLSWTSDCNQDGECKSSVGETNLASSRESFHLGLESESVYLLEQRLLESLKLRVLNIPNPPRILDTGVAKLAILFSGGLDCTVLARIVDELLPAKEEVDLLNVAFENPRVIDAAKKSKSNQKNIDMRDVSAIDDLTDLDSFYEACPDRITGRQSHQELQTVCTTRKWNFVAINVSYAETLAHRDTVISLIHPHNTEMDLSIAYALYFASRGSGYLSESRNANFRKYSTPARVLLSGLGADELFGGYTRHATAYTRKGSFGLVKELELDVKRLGKRNLGRDDRIISNWGREARYPYLDEDLVHWAISIPVWERCGFGQAEDALHIEPGKKVLRLLAWKLEMRNVAIEKKRAIQFGARTAKMENGRTKGTTLIANSLQCCPTWMAAHFARVKHCGHHHIDKHLNRHIEVTMDKATYFKQLYDLNNTSDDGGDLSSDEGKCSPRAKLRGPHNDSKIATPTFQRAMSAPLHPISVGRVVEDTPLASRTNKMEKSGSTADVVTVVGVTPIIPHLAEKKAPRRTVSNPTPNVSSHLLSSSPPQSVPRKRKRKEEALKLKPEAERIFQDLTFFYLPNDDIAPVRRARIKKARQYGALWVKDLSAQPSHIIADKPLSYEDIISYLKIPFLPSSTILANEDYPLDCIRYRAILNPSQRQYMVKGHHQAIKKAEARHSVSEKADGSLGSDQSLQLKPQSSKPGKWDYVPPRKTPEREEDSAPQVLGEAEIGRSGTRTFDVPSSSPLGSTYGDALDEMINEARKVEHLPLDEDDDQPPWHESSQDQMESDEEGESQVKKPLPRARKYGRKGSLNQESFSCIKGGTNSDLSTNPNARTISILQQMADFYTRMDDPWRPIAYRKAISTLRQQPRKITSAEEAFQLPFIGARLADKIQEIVLTDRLWRLENAKAEPSDRILQKFMDIYGVGSSQASKWLHQGYTCLEDLVAKADLTDNQRVGIAHYDDFRTRIPRDEVTALGKVIIESAKRVDEKVEIIIGGSYRRGATTSGDIDCIVTKSGTQSSHELIGFLHQLVTKLTVEKFLVEALSVPRYEAGSKWHGCCVLPGQDKPIWRRIDFLLVPASELGAALIYFTGNDIFNRSIRLLASRKGMRLNQRGLYRDIMRGPGRMKLNEGELVEGADEKKIFEILGVPWRPPHERIC